MKDYNSEQVGPIGLPRDPVEQREKELKVEGRFFEQSPFEEHARLYNVEKILRLLWTTMTDDVD